MYVYCVYYYACIKMQTYSKYFENIHAYSKYIFIYVLTFYIIYKYIEHKHNLNIHMHVFVFIYTYTHIYYVNKNFYFGCN